MGNMEMPLIHNKYVIFFVHANLTECRLSFYVRVTHFTEVFVVLS